MAKKKEVVEKEVTKTKKKVTTENEESKPKKKKMTTAQKNKLVMQVVAWILVLIMGFGVLVTIFGPLLLNR